MLTVWHQYRPDSPPALYGWTRSAAAAAALEVADLPCWRELRCSVEGIRSRITPAGIGGLLRAAGPRLVALDLTGCKLDLPTLRACLVQNAPALGSLQVLSLRNMRASHAYAAASAELAGAAAPESDGLAAAGLRRGGSDGRPMAEQQNPLPSGNGLSAASRAAWMGRQSAALLGAVLPKCPPVPTKYPQQPVCRSLKKVPGFDVLSPLLTEPPNRKS